MSLEKENARFPSVVSGRTLEQAIELARVASDKYEIGRRVHDHINLANLKHQKDLKFSDVGLIGMKLQMDLMDAREAQEAYATLLGYAADYPHNVTIFDIVDRNRQLHIDIIHKITTIQSELEIFKAFAKKFK